ncbi:MAG: DUF1232 domain-containing protein [Ideonella sp.]|nr:DUF1232 domain-containing protein [Ideonella sp.]MCC7457690.1 DUF1232 domain-containing protein [Nitrospira sp.]
MWKRVSILWAVVRGDARVLWHALRHPQAPRWLKLGVLGIVLYLISPVDLIPDVVPVFGVVDDLVVVPLAIRWLLRRLPPALRAEAERRAGRVGGTPMAEEVR